MDAGKSDQASPGVRRRPPPAKLSSAGPLVMRTGERSLPAALNLGRPGLPAQRGSQRLARDGTCRKALPSPPERQSAAVPASAPSEFVAHLGATGGVRQPATVRRLFRIFLDMTALAAMLAASLSITAFYWFADDHLDAFFLDVFSSTFNAGVICFGAARIVELLELVFEPPTKRISAALHAPARQPRTPEVDNSGDAKVMAQRHP